MSYSVSMLKQSLQTWGIDSKHTVRGVSQSGTAAIIFIFPTVKAYIKRSVPITFLPIVLVPICEHTISTLLPPYHSMLPILYESTVPMKVNPFGWNAIDGMLFRFKRHRVALKLTLYQLHANILSTHWFYDTFH
eukprot:jgi/Psemu1/3942/gm1.3942_g